MVQSWSFGVRQGGVGVLASYSLAGERLRPSFWEVCLTRGPVSGLSGLRESVYAMLSTKVAREGGSRFMIIGVSYCSYIHPLPFLRLASASIDLLAHTLAILIAPFMHHLRKYYSLNILRSNA